MTNRSAAIESRRFEVKIEVEGSSTERAHRTCTEEFYEVEDFPLDMAGLNQPY